MLTVKHWIRRQVGMVLWGALATVVITAAGPSTATADPPSLLRVFGKKSVEADPGRSYTLTEEDGPWLILAATFAGESGLEKAEKLVLEMRSDYDLPAFIYRESFDFSGRVPDLHTTGARVRYANPQSYETFSVLVGEFDSVDHPAIDRTLETIKTATPKAYNGKGQDDSPLAAVRRFQRQLLGEKKEGGKPPMATAFVTRNPLLPDDFFQQPEVDSFVMSINKEVEHSLLENPGKFTVVVRTFEGLSTFVDGKHDKEFKPSAQRLNDFALQAHRMVTALREKGVEAYEFHDRRRSLVTVGSFDELGVRTADGGFQYTPEILAVMRKYCAGNTYTRTPDGRHMAIKANHIDWIPFDVNPKPIAVPKKSKRSLYTATLDALGRN
ncbi:hypothetical protein [Roseimaritima sediminicola]|uniref:hypothetical protein n=1 Tax=Roseimaritima sediminicola TaxID=2662066 RepID=UPI001F2D0A4C|nr:hypothetical protein [Roseimaritima sediminicola]